MKHLVILAGLITALMVTSCASAIVVYFWDEDFENLSTGSITAQRSTYYDTYALSGGVPALFVDDWNTTQGNGSVVDVSGNKFLQVWYTGWETEWGKVAYGSHILDPRGDYHSPMVVEYKLRPGYNPSGNGRGDSLRDDRVMAMKWRMCPDENAYSSGSKIGWCLYYDGYLFQTMSSVAGMQGSADVGTMSGSGMDIWDRTADDWLYFKCYLDPEAGYMKTYLSADSTIDESDLVFSHSTYNLTDDVKFRQLQDCQGGSGTDNEPDSLKADFDDIKVYYTEVPMGNYIEGTVTMGYPGWEDIKYMCNWQVRSPGLPPTEPVYDGFEWIQADIDPVQQRAVTFRVGPFAEGTYDFAMKHLPNHVAAMAASVDISAGDATGLALTLWAGDGDGDDNPGNYAGSTPPDNTGDNDVDFYDYYTLYYQYTSAVGTSTGFNCDFDWDGVVGFYDYYGLYYGYLNAPDPGNWYYAP